MKKRKRRQRRSKKVNMLAGAGVKETKSEQNVERVDGVGEGRRQKRD